MSVNKLADKILLDSYKQLRLNISQNLSNKNILIVDFANNIDIYTKKSILTTTEDDNVNQIKKMLKNPLEINIYNDFKKPKDNEVFNDNSNNNENKSGLQSKLNIQSLISKTN